MADSEDSFEIDDTLNQLLIDQIKQYPTLYYTDAYTETDELHWDAIQRDTGIQKSWMKKRWKSIRNDHRKITIFNHFHSNKVSLHSMSHKLDFLIVDLNGATEINFDDMKQVKSATFCITQEMLDNCDISENITSIPKLLQIEPVRDQNAHSYITITTDNTSIKMHDELNSSKNKKIANVPSETNKSHGETESISINPSTDRCEDEIFGELIVSMMKKMSPEEKRRAKKEIMNILL